MVAPIDVPRYAIAVPQYVDDAGFDEAGFRAHLTRAEELSFDGAWVQEQVLGSAPALSPIVALAYAAACTTRLRLGCAVFVTPLHNPVQLARNLGSLDQVSHGRLEVGVGTGGRGRPFEAFGVDPSTFVTRFTEGLELMKACWSEHEINFDGHFWRLEGQAMEPKPVQRPHPPIWIGGSHPNAVRRAVRLGDGFFGAGSQTTARFAEQVRLVREELAGRARERSDFAIAKRVYIHVDDYEPRARELIAAALERHYGHGGLEPVAVAGPPGVCADGLREVLRAGAEMILLNPLLDDMNQLERLAGEVLPQL